MFAAAGILFVKSNGTVLLSREPKGWTIPGGRKESNEQPINTAVREVCEETRGILSHKYLYQVLNIGHKRMWFSKGRYYLHIVKVDESFLPNIDQLYQQRPSYKLSPGYKVDWVQWSIINSWEASEFLKRVFGCLEVQKTLKKYFVKNPIVCTGEQYNTEFLYEEEHLLPLIEIKNN